jgi:hypothetical protein
VPSPLMSARTQMCKKKPAQWCYLNGQVVRARHISFQNLVHYWVRAPDTSHVRADMHRAPWPTYKSVSPPRFHSWDGAEIGKTVGEDAAATTWALPHQTFIQKLGKRSPPADEGWDPPLLHGMKDTKLGQIGSADGRRLGNSKRVHRHIPVQYFTAELNNVPLKRLAG